MLCYRDISPFKGEFCLVLPIVGYLSKFARKAKRYTMEISMCGTHHPVWYSSSSMCGTHHLIGTT
jgi:hypothetical protein